MNRHPGSEERWMLHVWVEGRVQGVMFRESTRRAAHTLGLSGWVRNLPDGRVEACFVGVRATCEQALAFVRVGPPGAVVTHVESRWEAAGTAVPGHFEVR
ncbi:MAG TPA: acylphosphatase [Dongiaceae bacterium]|nr:acylphosphatase [Dongiaceae bacterium]